MPIFLLKPEPQMSDQRLGKRLGIGLLPNILIDPTCGRYCLKSLLKYHYEVATGVTPENVVLPKPDSQISDRVGYDPEKDFQHFDDLLEAPDDLPGSLQQYIDLLRNRGPIIVNGKGVGHASSLVGHYILLIGGNTTTEEPLLYYKDPLRGDEVGRESYASMYQKITWIAHAKADIATALTRLGLGFQVANMAFQ